jgi:hypothetical protein
MIFLIFFKKYSHEEVVKNKLKMEEYEDVLEGEKMVLSQISFQNFTVTISSPEKIDGGFFSKSYITYLLKTEPFGLKVRRRYSDFEWLRSILCDHFPAYLIPPIPIKSFSDRFNDEFVEKRMRYLQKFLFCIDSNPTLSSTSFYYDFLSITDQSEFNKKKIAHSKSKIPTKLNEYKSVDGSVSNLIF